MIVTKIDLYKYFNIERPSGATGYLTAYVHEQPAEFCLGRKRPAILVIPGGAYVGCSTRETEPVALKYISEGFNAFVLEYSCRPVTYPAQLIEGKMAIAYIRENADKLNVLSNKIAGIGFSAGGHLCSMLATETGLEDVQKVLGKKAKITNLNAAILSYPVITTTQSFMHKLSRDCLCGNDKEYEVKCSTELNVTKNCPPAFIWTTADDDQVPSENSLVMAMAYRKAGVPFELHVYKKGHHGLSLSTRETATHTNKGFYNLDVSSWFDLSITFLKSLKFEIKL